MKKDVKKFGKLSLNKETIAKLNNSEMDSLKGGVAQNGPEDRPKSQTRGIRRKACCTRW